MNLRTFFAFDPKDTDEIRLEKFAIFLVAASCCLAGFVWTAMYYFAFGWGLTTILPAFDHILAIELGDLLPGPLTDKDLEIGVAITFPQRQNTITELYFEAGELAMAM